LITDPTRNNCVKDNHMPELPMDLSKYLLIFAMNSDDCLPEHLKSRVPIVHLTGYTQSDKAQILTNFILPEMYQQFSFDPQEIIFSPSALNVLLTEVKEHEDKFGRVRLGTGVRRLKDVVLRIFRRLNIYYLAAIDGKVGVSKSYSFHINNFQLPYVIDTEFARAAINKTTEELCSEMHTSLLYI